MVLLVHHYDRDRDAGKHGYDEACVEMDSLGAIDAVPDDHRASRCDNEPAASLQLAGELLRREPAQEVLGVG